jgi:hypothetical protein
MRRGAGYWIIIATIVAYFSILGAGIYFTGSPPKSLCEVSGADCSVVLVRLSLATAIYNSTFQDKPVVMIWHGGTSTRVAGTIEDLKKNCGMGD